MTSRDKIPEAEIFQSLGKSRNLLNLLLGATKNLTVVCYFGTRAISTLQNGGKIRRLYLVDFLFEVENYYEIDEAW